MTPATEADDVDVKRVALKHDLEVCDGVVNVRDSAFAQNGVVIETDQHGLQTETLKVLAKHGARVSEKSSKDGGFSVFLTE